MSLERSEEDPLERTVNPDGMTDSVSSRRMHEIREGQVCCLKLPSKGKTVTGTGFLIGPDTILTNWHVVEQFDPSKGEARALFDFKNDADGLSIRNVRSVDLAQKNPILASRPYAESDGKGDGVLPSAEELDYAVLRLGEPIGEDRGWSVLASEETAVRTGQPLTILQHPNGDPLKMDTDTVKGWNENGTRVYYTTNSDKGSSGSPCFDKGWNLVALHHAGTSEYNQGIPAHLIRADLEKQGVWESIRAEEVQPADLLKSNAPAKRPATISQTVTGNTRSVVQVGGNLEGGVHNIINKIPGKLIAVALGLLLLLVAGFVIYEKRSDKKVEDSNALTEQLLIEISSRLTVVERQKSRELVPDDQSANREQIYQNTFEEVARKHRIDELELRSRFEEYARWARQEDSSATDYQRALAEYGDQHFGKSAKFAEAAAASYIGIFKEKAEEADLLRQTSHEALILAGSSHLQIENWERAHHNFWQAVKLWNKTEETRNWAEAAGWVCLANYRSGNIDLAKSFALEVSSLMKKELGEKDPDTLRFHSILGFILAEEGETDNALAILKETRGLQEQVLGKTHPHLLETLDHLGFVYRRLNDYEKAINVYEDAFELSDSLPGSEDLKAAHYLVYLGQAYMGIHNFEEACLIFGMARKRLEQVLDPEHEDVLIVSRYLERAQRQSSRKRIIERRN